MVITKETKSQRYYRKHHKKCLEAQRKWRESHREYNCAVRKKHYYENREEEIRKRQQWRQDNLEKDIETGKKRYQKTKEFQLVRHKIYKDDKKNKVISHYSRGRMECEKCGNKDFTYLSVDHPNLDGTEFRKKNNIHGGLDMYLWIIKNNYPKGLRILCISCNSSHKKKRNIKHSKEGRFMS